MYWWLDMGVDGLRLDAIPYLIERDGTNNENLPETHEVLKKIRAALDERYDDRMLLAEANQWPEDTATYFGEGDERSEEHTSELQSLMRISYAVFCLKKKTNQRNNT